MSRFCPDTTAAPCYKVAGLRPSPPREGAHGRPGRGGDDGRSRATFDEQHQTKRNGRRARGDGGAALVEFALIVPLVFALLFGVFTGGISLSRKNSMTNAVREGARFGATLPEDADWADKVQARVIDLAGRRPGRLPGVRRADHQAQPSHRDGSTGQPLRAPSTAALEPDTDDVPVGECAVKVWAARESDLQVIFFSKTLELTGELGQPVRARRRAGDVRALSRLSVTPAPRRGQRRQRRHAHPVRGGHGGDRDHRRPGGRL